MGKLQMDMTIPDEVLNFDWDAYEHSDRTTLKENTAIRTKDGDKVFSFAPNAQEIYDRMSDIVVYDKEFKLNAILNVTNVLKINGTMVTFEFDNYVEFTIDISKESKFLKLIGLDEMYFLQEIERMSNEERIRHFRNHPMYGQISSVKPVLKVSLLKGFYQQMRREFMDQLEKPSAGYTAHIVGKNKGGFIAEINGVETFLPGGLAAPNKIHDFDSYIGKDVIVMIEDYLQESGIFVVSHKKWIKFSMESKINELNTRDEYTGYVTGAAKYGVFVEFESFFTGLLHKSKMSNETLSRFNDRNFKPGDPISFYITRIDHKGDNTKIILTDKKPLTEVEEWKSLMDANKVISVTVISSNHNQVTVKTRSGILTNLEGVTDHTLYDVGDRTLVQISDVQGDEEEFRIVLIPKDNG